MNKLGKLAPHFDSRTFKLAKYMPAITPPATVNWGAKVPSWPMYDNDTLGDCVCAAAGHLVQEWTADASAEVTLPVAAVLTMYQQVGGYVPGDPSTDNGCDMLTACKWLRNTGIGGHEIEGFGTVNPKNALQVKSTVFALGALYLGVALPLTAQDQKAWSVVPDDGSGSSAPGSWGGHCVPIVAYSPSGLTCITWGAPLVMTWQFLATYADEAYGLLSPDWIAKSGMAPSNFNLSQLEADLAQL